MNKIGSLLGKKIETMLPTRSHFRTVMANKDEVKFSFFLSFRAYRDIRRPSSEWGLSLVEERFIII